MQGSTRRAMGMTRFVAQCLTAVWILFVGMAPAHGVTVTGLYSVTVPVKSSQPNDLAQGYADGLRRVFIRVAGSEDVLAQEGIGDLLDNAESLLQSYQYLSSAESGNALEMSFGAVGVNKALASIGAPVWGANRPLMLSWIAVEASGTRTLLHSGSGLDATMPWRLAFRQAFAERGLPVDLPPESYANRRELMSDIWGQFTGNVRAESGNLAHDLISLVRINRVGNQWRAGWVLDGMDLGGPEQSVTAATPEALASAVVGRWAEMFADRYAVEGSAVGDSPKVNIVLHGVRGLKDFADSNRVFQNLSPVEAANAMGTQGDQLTFRLSFSGEIEQLKRYIALDPRLVPLSEAEVSSLPADDGDETSEGSPAEVSSPESGGAVTQPAGQSSYVATGPSTANPLSEYSALLAKQDTSEKEFEALYQVLHYRWQPASIVGGEAGE